MDELADKWAGRIYGTNTGNVFLEISQKDASIKGRLRIMDSVYGVSLYTCVGTVSDSIEMTCEPEQDIEGVVQGTVTVQGRLDEEGRLHGSWESSIGTGGTFEMYPHNIEKVDKTKNHEQIHNKTVPIGSVRLFKSDLLQLVNYISKDFTAGRVIVTYHSRGVELTKYADDFFNQLDDIEHLQYIKLVIQEPEAYGINRVVVIELGVHGFSEIRVSGINESWVLGKAESVYQFLKPKQNALVTTYRKHGLNINSVLFAVLLISLPEISDWKSRGIFVICAFTLLGILMHMHAKYIPNTSIYLTESKPSFVKRIWPSLLSWFIAASSSLAAAYVFYLLKGQ